MVAERRELVNEKLTKSTGFSTVAEDRGEAALAAFQPLSRYAPIPEPEPNSLPTTSRPPSGPLQAMDYLASARPAAGRCGTPVADARRSAIWPVSYFGWVMLFDERQFPEGLEQLGLINGFDQVGVAEAMEGAAGVLHVVERRGHDDLRSADGREQSTGFLQGPNSLERHAVRPFPAS